MHVQGRCHCGQITYEADVDPAEVSACHCTDCQMLCGSAYRVSVGAAKPSLTGQPRTYVKVADSGARRVHAFCGDCGTPTYACAPDDPPTYSLRVGCLDQRETLGPRRQIWYRSAVPWSQDLRSVPQVDRQ